MINKYLFIQLRGDVALKSIRFQTRGHEILALPLPIIFSVSKCQDWEVTLQLRFSRVSLQLLACAVYKATNQTLQDAFVFV